MNPDAVPGARLPLVPGIRVVERKSYRAVFYVQPGRVEPVDREVDAERRFLVPGALFADALHADRHVAIVQRFNAALNRPIAV